MRRHVSRLPVVFLALVAALALFAAACGPRTDPDVVTATQKYRQAMTGDDQYAQYGLEVAGRSSAPLAKQLIIENLTSPTYSIALAAVKAADRQNDPVFLEPLKKIFQEKKGVIQLDAGIALARLGDADAMAWLKDHLVDLSGVINDPVALLLAEKGETDPVRKALEERIHSKSDVVRDDAYALLGQVHQPWATELLLKGLKGEHGARRKVAIQALGQTGDPGVAPEIRRFLGTRGLVFAAIETLGNLGDTKAIPELKKLMRSKEDLVKVYAGVALWKLGQKGLVLPVLGPLVGSGDPVVRRNLAEQLGSLNDVDALGMLATLAEDKDRDTRMAAAGALRESGQEGLQDILMGLVNDKDYDIACLALDALGDVGTGPAVEKIKPLLDNRNPYVVISAANAVLEIKAREAAQPAAQS